MIRGLFGGHTVVGMLRDGLDWSSLRHREIASRVARATTTSASGAAPGPSAAPGEGGGPEVDLEREMVALADTQLRFEATAQLLRKAYAQLHTAVRDRG